jgi:Rieske Fe-S protein
MNHNRPVFSRREFFAALAPVLTVPALMWWLLTGRRSRNSDSAGREMIISGQLPQGVSFREDLILVREGNRLNAFKDRCTHLGCRIQKLEGNELVCGCHGSRFSLSGDVIRGPASEPLKSCRISRDERSGNYIIRIT